MDDLARHTLCQLIQEHGSLLAQDARRCKGLLMDFCGLCKKEIFVLVSSIEENVVQELLNNGADALQQLSLRLQENRALTPIAARWAVESWALALGKIAVNEITVKGSPKTTREQTVMAEAELRQAIRKALADQVITHQEKFDLRAQCQQLGIPIQRASRIFTEIKNEIQQQPSSLKTVMAEAKLRQSTRKALADQVINRQEKFDLLAHAQQLEINFQRANQIFAEIQDEIQQQTLMVTQDGDGHFNNLTEALENASPGTRIFIRPGRYVGSYNLKIPVEIIGDGPRDDIVLTATDNSIFKIETDVTIRGLTLACQEGLRKDNFAALEIVRGQPLIETSRIYSGYEATISCVIIDGKGTHPIFKDCQIHGFRGAFWFHEYATGQIQNGQITGGNWSAIQIGKGANPSIQNSQISDSLTALTIAGQGKIIDCEIKNHKKSGIEIHFGGTPLIQNCRIHHNPIGILLGEDGKGRIESNQIYENKQAGILIGNGSKPVIVMNHIYQNNTGIQIENGGDGVIVDNNLQRNKQEALKKPRFLKLHYKRNRT